MIRKLFNEWSLTLLDKALYAGVFIMDYLPAVEIQRNKNKKSASSFEKT